ncbi:pilus assembly protein TadG-related protein [Qipengyuania sp. DGS5-3]|uniref:pilus assembly protein TadG-related protein n=1 Tax=Qipengyuania sp. DGS5-3 TaxID=3349632 RepID=UPI0036D2D501
MVNSRGFLTELRKSKEANVFPLTAAAVFVLAGLVGGGVDMSRAYMVQNRLQNACDSAVLAGRREVDTNGFDTAAQQATNNYFNVNFQNESGTSGTTFTPTTPNNGQTVNGAASTNLNTTIMNLFGFEELPLSVTCTATMSVGNSDVIMVLDTTGSMDWDIAGNTTTNDADRRITALRGAMQSFYTTLDNATAGTAARIRYGFVPYSQTVNVGHLLQPTWLADEVTIQSREPDFNETEVTTGEVASYLPPVTTTDTTSENFESGDWYIVSGSYRNKNQCRAQQPADTSWQNNGGVTNSSDTFIDAGQNRITLETRVRPQRRTDFTCERRGRQDWNVVGRTQTRDRVETTTTTEAPVFVTTTIQTFDHWDYREREDIDVSAYKTGSAITFQNADEDASLGIENGDPESYTWAGCIEERSSVVTDTISYNTLIGLQPSGLNDVAIDLVPTTEETRWKPLLEEMSYFRVTSDGRFITRADETERGQKSFATCPAQSQLLSTMTQAQFDNVVNSLDPRGGTYHSIGMIWGTRLASPQGLFASNVNQTPPNGGNVARHIIFMTDGVMDTSIVSHSAWGVELYDQRITDDGINDRNERHFERFQAACQIARSKGIRVWVVAFATTLTTELEQCASTDSSFTAATSAQLETAFQEIARNVGELRVTQ